MAAATTDRELDQRVATARTRSAGHPATVDAQVILVVARRTVAVAVIRDGRAAIGETFPQNGADSLVEPANFLGRQTPGISQRMEPGPKQRLVDVDVAE